MRITYRSHGNKEYWEKRWADIPADLPMENTHVYPLKYAELTIQQKNGFILEAGCGAGRILRYYKDRGYRITGIDFIENAIAKLKGIDPSLDVHVADITKLPFRDESFQYVLAFGLYHNLEHGLTQALNETYRVLKTGGKLCASFRADNIQTRLSDFVEAYRFRRQHGRLERNQFHKTNLTKTECRLLFERAGFHIESIHAASNMPFLYKYEYFRHPTHKIFDENKARSDGYQLSTFGKFLTKFFMKFFPNQFCNIYVLIAQKP